jgi:prepilin-type processing-associated H-X9-DG protein
VELLVVIGIIALLISVLLPALNRARRAAYSVSCLANLRSIGQAMNVYAAENKGWIPGSGWTSGAMFFNMRTSPPAFNPAGYTNTHCPTLNEPNDWVGVLARMMGIKHSDLDGLDTVSRYKLYRSFGWMSCPAYRDVAVLSTVPGTADDAGSGPGLSYCLAQCFLNRSWDAISRGQAQSPGTAPLNGPLIVALNSASKPIVRLPADYGPRLNKVGDSTAKVFASDGARVLFQANGYRYAQYTINVGNGWASSPFIDMGAFGGNSQSVNRAAVPGNATSSPPFDNRALSVRHGVSKPFQRAGEYRMNVVFFDGHAETLDDVQAANPAIWMPKGSVITPTVGASLNVDGTKTVWSDVQARYCPGVISNLQTWTAP